MYFEEVPELENTLRGAFDTSVAVIWGRSQLFDTACQEESLYILWILPPAAKFSGTVSTILFSKIFRDNMIGMSRQNRAMHRRPLNNQSLGIDRGCGETITPLLSA